MPLQAMILAAGLGTRLLPLTKYLPKPLFPVANIPILKRNLDLLAWEGFSSITVNLYHLGHMVSKLISSVQEEWRSSSRDCRIVTVEEQRLMGTGGGIRNASPHFHPQEPILVLNSDIFMGFSPRLLMELHKREGATATLLLHRRREFECVDVDLEGNIVGFRSGIEGQQWAFTGAYVLDHSIIHMIPDGVPCSIIPVIEKAIAQGMPVKAAYPWDCSPSDGAPFFWEDIGTPRGYLSAHSIYVSRTGFTLVAPPDCDTEELNVLDWAVLGSGVEVGKDVTLERCVVWPDVSLGHGFVARDTIITPYGMLKA